MDLAAGTGILQELTSDLGEVNRVRFSGEVAPGFSHARIVPDDASGKRVFSGFSCFPRPFIPALLHTHLSSLSSALKSSMLRATQISSIAHPSHCDTIACKSGFEEIVRRVDQLLVLIFNAREGKRALRRLTDTSASFDTSSVDNRVTLRHRNKDVRWIKWRDYLLRLNSCTNVYSSVTILTSTALAKMPIALGSGTVEYNANNGTAPECKGRRNGRPPIKSADQRHRPARLPLTKNSEVTRPGIELDSPWWKASSPTAQPPSVRGGSVKKKKNPPYRLAAPRHLLPPPDVRDLTPAREATAVDIFQYFAAGTSPTDITALTHVPNPAVFATVGMFPACWIQLFRELITRLRSRPHFSCRAENPVYVPSCERMG
ncbi:hypothetical protein PR048_029218 [Dryococelus australis]|uniref:Uncharacterized protein n=1 Tax=Dryococelus australis TaxID=614101 RepID=A0ABQ9GCS3_9NEOP|nr:hypothetical protein PR048_029218 [Dryococelus australis]